MTGNTTNWARYQKRIRDVIEYIHNNVSGDLSSDVLADVAHLSVYHWHRIYRAITGESAAATVKRCRMHRAAAGLLRGDETVAAIGASVGVTDVRSFTRTFKDYYGVAPGQFRVAHQQTGTDSQEVVQGNSTIAGSTMDQAVRIVDMPDTRLIGVWHRGDYMQIGQSFDKVMALCGIHALLPDIPQITGVYHGDPEIMPMHEQRSFAGVVADTANRLPADLESYVHTGGRFAVLTHKGPYALLGNSYGWLYGRWLPASGESIRDCPCCEMYLNSPVGTKPDELLTEIYLPLE